MEPLWPLLKQHLDLEYKKHPAGVSLAAVCAVLAVIKHDGLDSKTAYFVRQS